MKIAYTLGGLGGSWASAGLKTFAEMYVKTADSRCSPSGTGPVLGKIAPTNKKGVGFGVGSAGATGGMVGITGTGAPFSVGTNVGVATGVVTGVVGVATGAGTVGVGTGGILGATPVLGKPCENVGFGVVGAIGAGVVGELVGLAVVGAAVVGKFVGPSVISGVGPPVGPSVGRTVGFLVGFLEGLLVGFFDGLLVGWAVGSLVGLRVG